MRLIAHNISIIRSQSNAPYNSTLLFSYVVFYSNRSKEGRYAIHSSSMLVGRNFLYVQIFNNNWIKWNAIFAQDCFFFHLHLEIEKHLFCSWLGFSVLMFKLFMSDTCSYSLNQLSWDVGTGAVLSFHAGVTHGILPYKRSCRLESSCVQSNSCHSRHVTEETDESIFKFQTHTAHIIWLDPFITQNLIWADMP